MTDRAGRATPAAGATPAVEPAATAREAVHHAFRTEYGRTVAILLRTSRDLDAIEDAVQDAFEAAARTWPAQGVPPNPQAWVVTAARRRLIDGFRRQASAGRVAQRLVSEGGGVPPVTDAPGSPAAASPDALGAATVRAGEDLGGTAADPGDVMDDELRLLFLCAHPALSPASQVALTLRFVGGLTTAEVARAFGVPESTAGQRLSRAKAKVRDAGIVPRLPDPDHWGARLGVVLAVIYAIYNEGYVTTEGPLTRSDLTDEALRLARHLHALVPRDPEAKGLLALLLLLHARRRARTAGGVLTTLEQQDRGLWDADLVAEGHRLVRECLATNRPGPYQIQAAIQAVHADAPSAAAVDWRQVLALYDQLLLFLPSSAAQVARAVAVAHVDGARAGLSALDATPADTAGNHYATAVRADLLEQLGRAGEASRLFTEAASAASNPAEQAHLRERARVAAEAAGRTGPM